MMYGKNVRQMTNVRILLRKYSCRMQSIKMAALRTLSLADGLMLAADELLEIGR